MSQNQPAMARIVSFTVLLLTIVVMGLMFFRVMAGFWLPLFLAALLVVMFKPVHEYFLSRTRGRERLAAILTTLTVLVVVLAPLGWAVTLAVTEAADLYARPNDRVVEDKLAELRERFGLVIPYPEVDELQSTIQKLAPPEDLEDEVDWPGYSWDLARARLAHLHATIETLALRIRVKRDSHVDGPESAEQVKNETLLIQLDELSRIVEQLQLTVQPQAPVNGESVLPPDTTEYLQLHNQAELRYGTFRRTLLGGASRAWLVELANPHEAELDEWRNKATSYIQRWLLSVTGQTVASLGSLVFGLCIMVIAIYYFLIDGPTLIKAGMRLSPLDDDYELELLAEFDKISRAVVIATLLSAVVQGILASIGYYFAGVGSVFLLLILTTLFALVPFVGAAAVWVPVCLWLAFVEGHTTAAIGLGIWGGVVVSMADNVIKPWVLHGQSNLHPLLALLSVLGGVQALGPIGILVGPMIVTFLQVLLNILQKDLRRMERSTRAARGSRG
ncbi:MAG: AI-2E family transporter [Planctomycetales bacterium]|nr:AI-2E family transporter [Planctomycetales bacterium]